MRDNHGRKSLEIADLERHLAQGSKLDLDAMRRNVARLAQQLAMDRRALESWEQTAAAELRRAGVSDSEIDSAFRIANPAILKLIIGETATIKDRNTTLERIRLLAGGVQTGKYADASIELDVSGVAGPAAECDPRELQGQITLQEDELGQQRRRLQVAEDQTKARESLNRLRDEREDLRKQLDEYDRHMEAWQNRSTLEHRLKDAEAAVGDLEKEITGIAGRLDSQTQELNRVDQGLHSIAGHKRSLDMATRELRETAARLGFDSYLPAADREDLDEEMRPKQVSQFVESVTGKLSELTNGLHQISESRTQLKKLQNAIADKSRQFEGQQRYFSDEDSEWDSLIETLELLPQLDEATRKTWDALFTTLGARFNAIVAAVSSIKIAVERINQGLKAYHVSNLRTVEIKPDVVNDTYSAVEALSSQGSLFQDRDAVDLAKKRLRQMIEQNDVIDLESLFELRIRIEEADGTWHEAPSLDEIGSTGTGMTAKAMIFVQLMRAIAANEQFRLHFYIDGLGELDDRNLEATAAIAVSKGIVPITADPRLHLEPLAQPEVTVYTLGQNDQGQFFIDQYKTYHARRQAQSTRVGP